MNSSYLKFNKIIKIFLIILVFFLGIYLRSVAYLQNNSLFLDEGLVVLNLFEKQYFQLFLPLDYNQAAPPFFLIISKLAFESFGVNELALRFFPYLTSILSLGFFYLLSKKIFDKYTTVLVCFFVFAINPQLIWMSQNLKPYISDVMFTTIALLIAVSININHLDKKKSFFIGLSSAVCLWFSYAVLFVISAFSFVFAAEVFSGKNKSTENKQKFIIYLIPNVISFVIYFLTNLLWVKQNNFLHKFWSTVYAFAPHSLNDFIKVFGFLFEHFNFCLIVFLFFFGLYFLYKKNEVQLWIFLFPILLALWCAYCGIYPFADRLVLYLLPVFLIVIFMPLDKISFDKKLYSTFLIIVYFLLITPVCKYFVLPVVQNKISFAFADTREGYLKLVK